MLFRVEQNSFCKHNYGLDTPINFEQRIQFTIYGSATLVTQFNRPFHAQAKKCA